VDLDKSLGACLGGTFYYASFAGNDRKQTSKKSLTDVKNHHRIGGTNCKNCAKK
jgi:hypothetical protein